MCYMTTQQHIELRSSRANISWCFRKLIFQNLFYFDKIAQTG